ncbi:MAG: hypothetical protein ACR652_00800 [Methylocystis sp.]|uniref:hypothetical protein n=1 Tax=Methylocystis sp. TaxID=1911079 RepID=UPI003DA6BA63
MGAPQEAFGHIAQAFEISERAAAEIATIRKDATLTRAGQSIAIERALKAGPIGHLKQLRSDVDKRLSDATGQRSVLRDRVTGADNFPKSLKQEVRQYLRELEPKERMKMIQTDDPLIREAVVSAPHFLSGLPQDVWEHAVTAAVEAVHGEHLKAIDALEAAYSEAQAALQVASDDIQRAAEIDAGEFAKLAA